MFEESYLAVLDEAIGGIDLSELDGRSILVTGASGLIGSALCDLLLRAGEMCGLRVRLHLAGRDAAKLRKRFSRWDGDRWEAAAYDALLPLDFGFRADYVVHCAGNAQPRAYAEEPVETIMVNIVGTANILEYARSVNAKRVLYVSSSEVYGCRDSREPYKEGDCCPVDSLDPRSCLPSSKRVCETLCASYLVEHGVESVIARPGHVYGPIAAESDMRAYAQFARAAFMGGDIVMKSPGNQLRSYIFTTDCAAALLTVLLRGRVGEAYNIGDPDFACTIRELAEAFAAKGNVQVANDDPSPEELKGFGSMACSALDCSKLKKLGFSCRVSLDRGVALMLASGKTGNGQ